MVFSNRCGLPRCILVLTIFLLSHGAIAGDVSDYHLTGVMGSDTGKAFAVIERADGQQRLLGEGDAYDNGHVERISARDKTVILAFPSGRVILSLTGSGLPDEYREEFSMSDYSAGDVEQKSLDLTAITRLQELSANSANIGEKELSKKLNQLLGFPAQTHIAAYDHEAVGSTRDLIRQLATQLPKRVKEGGDYLGSIAVSDDGGRRRVYLRTMGDGDQP